MAIAVVSIPVRDQRVARHWYETVMDFTVVRDEPIGPDARWVQLQPRTGGATVALVTWFDGMPPGGLQGLVLHVPDIDAEQPRLAAAGVAVSPIDAQPWGRFTTFRDPDGNGWIVATLTAPESVVAR